MRIEQLEYLSTVARLSSFRNASEELHVSQPALSETVRKCRKPVIAAIRGICYGGAAHLAVNCDIRICGDDARFRFVAANYGMPACGAILPNFQRIVGQKIGPGWSRRVKALVGGAEGCAHHVEMLGLMATVAFQTMGPLLARGIVRPVVDRVFPLDRIGAAHEYLQSNGSFGKVVIEIG